MGFCSLKVNGAVLDDLTEWIRDARRYLQRRRGWSPRVDFAELTFGKSDRAKALMQRQRPKWLAVRRSE